MARWRERRKRRQALVRRLLAVISAMIVAVMIYGVAGDDNNDDDDDDDDDNDRHSYIIPRERTTMAQIRQHHSDYYFQCAYRMTYDQFKNLVALLSPILEQRRSSSGRIHRNVRVNGLIADDLRVGICLRLLAGGSVSDIASVHGVAKSTVYSIIGEVIDAIMNCPALEISFPTNHEEQTRIAEGFRAISAAGFDCCVGVIDGILIWIEKPSKSSREFWNHLHAGAFFCDRKSKFGFNMQAITDAMGRFIAVWITTPASASDYMSFTTSPLYRMLLQPGFLKKGYALFGDNAYVSNEFMATPYKCAKRGLKDDYNFFHSEIRIRSETAFGMLTRRWGILRKPLSSRWKLPKQLRIAMACCLLHNFCIGDRDQVPAIAPLLDRDEFLVQSEGHMYAVGDDSNRNFADHLMDGGDHFDDTDLNEIRQRRSDPIRRKLRLRVKELGIHRPALH